MTNLPNRDDREAERRFIIVVRAPRHRHRRCRAANVPRRVENLLLLKKWFRWLLLQKISIIKIGLVYVIMIVIAAVVMAGATQHLHTRYIHTIWDRLQLKIQFLIYTNAKDDNLTLTELLILTFNVKGGFFPESAIRFLDLQISKKKIFQKTILNLKFKIPAHNIILLSTGNLNFKLRIVFLEYSFFGDWEIWKTNCTFWKKKTPLVPPKFKGKLPLSAPLFRRLYRGSQLGFFNFHVSIIKM